MHIFYSKESAGSGFRLDSQESAHLARVLRLKPGELVNVINGSGNLYTCRIESADPAGALLSVESVIEGYKRRNYSLHVAIAPTKSIDRFEWFVEKSVELGIDRISPIFCARSERRKVRTDRIEKITVAAMKQSVSATGVLIDPPVSFNEFIKGIHFPGRLIAYCKEGEESPGIKELISPGEDFTVLIGPEGDFTAGEIETALSAGFAPLSLGPSRLRTETAGVAVCSMVNLINQQALRQGPPSP